jgi:RNA polymerase sigma-32 factor
MESSPSRSDLARYLSRIREYPMLEAEDEAELARAWRDRRDPQAAERLIGSHLRLVAKVARGYSGYGLPISDMIAEGNMGMVQALNGFDPDRGYRFTTYALWWIRAAMQEYILRSWSMVRMGTTGAEKKLFFSLRRAKSNMNLLQEGDLSPDEAMLLAEHLKVPVADVAGMNGRLAGPDQSLNLPLPGMEDGQAQDWLVDPSDSQEEMLAQRQELERRRLQLKKAMEQLQERERSILAARRLAEEPLTLEDLSRQFGISRERVRQIEARAVEKLQRLMTGGRHAPSLMPA